MDPGRQVSRFLFFCLTCFPGATLFGQSPTLIFPQLADGGGYVFEILLTNPTLGEESGVVYFWDTSGSPMEIQLAGTGTTSVAYAIPSGGSKKITSDGAGELKVGVPAERGSLLGPLISSYRVRLFKGVSQIVVLEQPWREPIAFIRWAPGRPLLVLYNLNSPFPVHPIFSFLRVKRTHARGFQKTSMLPKRGL